VWRRAAAAVAAAVVAAPAGCGPSKQESTPNPDLKVPDIPPAEKREAPAMGGKAAPKGKQG
jgi:hypothetical protein